MTELGTTPLTGRTILIRPGDAKSVTAESLARLGARVVAWPQIEIGDPQSFDALDEALNNLFGYDWIIFRNVHAVEFFAHRLEQLKHQASDLDSLRVLAVGDATSEKLSSLRVHVDIFASQSSAKTLVAEIENYLGSREIIAQMNFLNLRAANSAEILSQSLEELDARVDRVVAYRTVADSSRLVQSSTLLRGGGIDCVALLESGAVEELATMFDGDDLNELFRGITVVAKGQDIAREAAQFGLNPRIIAGTELTQSLTDLIVNYFSMHSVDA